MVVGFDTQSYYQLGLIVEWFDFFLNKITTWKWESSQFPGSVKGLMYAFLLVINQNLVQFYFMDPVGIHKVVFSYMFLSSPPFGGRVAVWLLLILAPHGSFWWNFWNKVLFLSCVFHGWYRCETSFVRIRDRTVSFQKGGFFTTIQFWTLGMDLDS